MISSGAECSIKPYSGGPKEDSLKDRLTIITTTHPIPSNPTIEMIKRTQRSLFRVPGFRGCKKIIVFDGIRDNLGYLERRLDPAELGGRDLHYFASEKYEQFKANMLELTENNSYFENTTLIFCDEHLNLAGAIGQALSYVDTPFVFIHQHDIELVKDVDALNVVRTMENNSNVKCVRLNQLWNEQNIWDSLLDTHIEGQCFVPLLRTNLWSDQEHFCSVEYYTDFILPKMPERNCMEWVLMEEEKREVEKDISNHKIYGTYVYGKLGERPYLNNLDGSRCYGDNWEY